MNCKKRKTPQDAVTSNGAMSAKCRTTETSLDYSDSQSNRKQIGDQAGANLSNGDVAIWERRHRGYLLRFMARKYRGKSFAELRAWYEKDGDWHHGSKGCTMPIECVGELGKAMTDFADKYAS